MHELRKNFSDTAGSKAVREIPGFGYDIINITSLLSELFKNFKEL